MVKITLTSIGSNISDPLNIYANTGVGGSFVLYLTGISKSALLAGYTFSPAIGATAYQVRDTGSCAQILTLSGCTGGTTTTTTVAPATTTTTTLAPATTTTTTVAPVTTTTTTVAGTTSTSTSTSTSTTTLAPITTTSSTTLAPGTFNANWSSTMNGTGIYQITINGGSPVVTETTTASGSFTFTSGDQITLMMNAGSCGGCGGSISGNTFIQDSCGTPGCTITISKTGTTNLIINGSSCPATTTTTTLAPITTTSSTTLPPTTTTSTSTTLPPTTTTSTSTTLPPTTTTSTTPAPTTTTSTTLPSFGTIGMDNFSTDLIIGAVKVNTVPVTITSGSLPLVPGGSPSHVDGTTTYLGVYSVTIAIDSGTAGQYITLSDSNSTLFCYNYTGIPEQFDFTGVTINNITILQLYVGDGTCSSPYGPISGYISTDTSSICNGGGPGIVGPFSNIYCWQPGSDLVNGRTYYNSGGLTLYTPAYPSDYYTTGLGAGNTPGLFTGSVWYASTPCPGPTTTTSSTSTTTTTLPPLYYAMQRCSDSSDTFYTGPYPNGTFSYGRKLEGATSVFYIVTGNQSTPYSRTYVAVTDTGLSGCA